MVITDEIREIINESINVKTSGSLGNGTRHYKIPSSILRECEINAATAQTIVGYHPAGYSIYNINDDGVFTTWNCSNSCD